MNPNAKFLPNISKSSHLWLYLLTCIAITVMVYWGVLRAIDWLFFAGLSATTVLYQIVSFHHDMIDSKIWKLRKLEIQQTMNFNQNG